MRVLIVGGGIAGLTLAAKLRQQGRHPVVIEKASRFDDVGYRVGLYPLGSCVLHGLGNAYKGLVSRGVEVRTYEVRGLHGETLQRLDTALLRDVAESTHDNAEPLVALPLSDLVDVLRKACSGTEIRMGRSVASLEQNEDAVAVRYSGGGIEEFDLVVGCDGIHSSIREMAFGEPEVFDIGWTAWTWWGGRYLFPEDEVREYWGHRYFWGIYPVKNRCMYLAGLPNEIGGPGMDPADLQNAIRSATSRISELDENVRRAFEDAGALRAWPMTDVRAPEWRRGRVALCGDAAAAFLPIAGVGASCALRAAAALADELSKANAATIPRALDLYVKRCQKPIEVNQDNSRSAAHFMFLESDPIGWGRDQPIKYYPVHKMVHQIVECMRRPF